MRMIMRITMMMINKLKNMMMNIMMKIMPLNIVQVKHMRKMKTAANNDGTVYLVTDD